MIEVLARWVGAASGVWRGEHVALGHAAHRASARDMALTGPWVHPERELVLTGAFHLRRRGDLIRTLGLNNAQHWPDGRLALEAFVRWGEGAVHRLEGPFALAVWDPRAHRLFAARDPLGVLPLYFTEGPGPMAFASELRGLRTLPWAELAPDEVWILDYLARIYLDHDRTLYRGLRRLAPGHSLSWSPEGRSIQSYWEAPWSMRAAPVSQGTRRSEEAWVARLREALEGALRDSFPEGGEVGAELSGGLDSSGICGLARHLIPAGTRPLFTYAHVRPENFEGRLPDDARWAVDRVVAHCGLEHHRNFTGEEGGTSERFEALIRERDEPARFSTHLYADALFRAAESDGVRVLLSGFGGNNAVSSGASQVPHDLLWAGEWRAFMLELRSALVAGGAGWRRALAVAAPSWLHQGRALLRRGGRPDPAWQKLPFRGVRRELAEQLDLESRRAASVRSYTYAGMGSREVALQRLQAPDLAFRMAEEYSAALPFGLAYRYPLLDVDVIGAWMDTPPGFTFRQGRGRWLFRKAIEGRVPLEVVWNDRERASANPGAVVRRRALSAKLRRQVEGIGPSHPLREFVDLEQLLATPEIQRVGGDHPWERHNDQLNALILAARLERPAVDPVESNGV